MDIEYASDAKMSQSGQSLLRILMNNNMPNLDLLVREAIQNSLDAGDNGKYPVEVDFSYKEFETLNVSRYFSGIEDALNNRYSGVQKSIVIRDTNTVGLSGPVRLSDVKNFNYGNFVKLVYQISKPQQKDGAGGSWGLGKTVYFRVGMGLVVYYSRFFNSESGKYESRLAATLVENETLKGNLLSGNIENSRGIAWWGKYDGDSSTNRSTIPVTDEEEILEILSSFNIKPYFGGDTGTTIIIPFINENKLLGELKVSEENDAPWMHSIPAYLKICIPRWYVPRMRKDCLKFQKQYLMASVDEKIVNPAPYPCFGAIYEMYKACINYSKDQSYKYRNNEITIKEIKLQRTLKDGCAGWLAYVKLSAEDLEMQGNGNNSPSPYVFFNALSDFGNAENAPILMFTRKPGMIVGYRTSGEWLHGVPAPSDKKYIIALFVANSDNHLVDNNETLEDYLRSSESADHTNWTDVYIKNSQTLGNIVRRIQENVKKELKKSVADSDIQTRPEQNVSLGGRLAKLLLPSNIFNTATSINPGTQPPSNSGDSSPFYIREKRFSMKIVGPQNFSKSYVRVPVMISFGKSVKGSIEISVAKENGNIKGDEWESNGASSGMGSMFPASFFGFEFEKITVNSKGKPPTVVLNRYQYISTGGMTISGIKFDFERTNVFKVPYKMNLTLMKASGNMIVHGFLCYKLDSGINGRIDAYED